MSFFKAVTLNTQGWNWTLQDRFHQDKAAGLLRMARTGGWDVAFLSDLHSPDKEVVIALEEFILVLGTKAGFLLSPKA